MMIKVEAYVREDKFEDVKAALNAIGVNGLTVSPVSYTHLTLPTTSRV